MHCAVRGLRENLQMLDTLKKLFTDRAGTSARTEADEEHRLQLATAALLIETSRADRVKDEREFEIIRGAISKTFDMSDDESHALVELADQRVEDSTSYYEFTSLINRNFSAEEKLRVVELMWRVAYVDGDIDKYEEALIRRIADLIHVPHRQFIAAKLKVEQENVNR